MEYRVLRMAGGSGLYACGCNAAPLSTPIPVAGWSISVAMVSGMFAVNHMFDLGLF